MDKIRFIEKKNSDNEISEFWKMQDLKQGLGSTEDSDQMGQLSTHM